MPYPSEQQDRFIVRMPDGMRGTLAAAAKEAGRSMNAEVVHRLQRTFEDDAQREANRRALQESIAALPEGYAAFAHKRHTPGTTEAGAMDRLEQWLKIGEAWAFQAFEAAELMRQGKSGLSVIPPDAAVPSSVDLSEGLRDHSDDEKPRERG